MSKETIKDKDQQNDKGNPLPPILELFNILHEHNPDKFPKVNALKNYPNYYEAIGKENWIVTDRGESLNIKHAGSKSNLEYEIKLLLKFFKQHKDNKDPKLIIAGLTWNFNAKEFYRNYSPDLGHKKVYKILKSLGVEEETIKNYKRRYKDIRKKDECEIFIEEVYKYAEKHPKKLTFKIEELIRDLDVKFNESDLETWSKEKKLPNRIKYTKGKKFLEIKSKRSH